MSRFILGCLALCALALVIGPTATPNQQQTTLWQIADNSSSDNNGVLIIETYSASSLPIPPKNNSDFEPLPQTPGVEVAPENDSFASSAHPVTIEEDDILTEQNEQF